MEIKAIRKNPDYTASAVNLTNSPAVESALCKLQAVRGEMQTLIDKIEAQIPAELTNQRIYLAGAIARLEAEIRILIDEKGSYQDAYLGSYALKQRKESKSYRADRFEGRYPEYAPWVIVKAIDITKLNGLIKGGLLNESYLRDQGIIKISESYAYVIR